MGKGKREEGRGVWFRDRNDLKLTFRGRGGLKLTFRDRNGLKLT